MLLGPHASHEPWTAESFLWLVAEEKVTHVKDGQHLMCYGGLEGEGRHMKMNVPVFQELRAAPSG